MSKSKINKKLENFVKHLVLEGVRNSYLEDLHSGKGPSSKTNDFSDVKVISPYGEIAWNDLSRISDEEMKILIKDIVDRTYALFVSLSNYPELLNMIVEKGNPGISHWDEPRLLRSDISPKNMVLKFDEM